MKTEGFTIVGKPGTGKTLLLYDVAKELSKIDQTAVIHCGKLSYGQEILKTEIKNFNIIAAGYLKYHPEVIDNYHYILVDESHRFYPKQFDDLCNRVRKGKQICVFSSDPEQVLSSTEKRNAIVSKISSLPLLGKYELSEKIRTNKWRGAVTKYLCKRRCDRKGHTAFCYSYGYLFAFASAMQRDAIVLFDGRQINDADSIVVNFNLLFSVSTALVGSVDYYFVNQII